MRPRDQYRAYFWSRDGKYVLYVQDKGGDENYNIYAVNPSESPAAGEDVPKARNLTDLKAVRVLIYELPKNEPDTYLHRAQRSGCRLARPLPADHLYRRTNPAAQEHRPADGLGV